MGQGHPEKLSVLKYVKNVVRSLDMYSQRKYMLGKHRKYIYLANFMFHVIALRQSGNSKSQ